MTSSIALPDTKAITSSKVAVAGYGKHSPAAKLTLVPHEGLVYLDTMLDGRQYITHMSTYESKLLDSHQTWTLEFLDGFGALVPDDEGEDVVLVEDLLKFKWYAREGGQNVLITGSDEHLKSMEMEEYASRNSEGTLMVRAGNMSKEITITFTAFTWARQQCARLYFSAKDLYSQLGFSMFAKYPWRWHYDGALRWNKRLSKLGFYGHVMRSSRVVFLCVVYVDAFWNPLATNNERLNNGLLLLQETIFPDEWRFTFFSGNHIS
jgi:hypothetical protein